MYVMIIKCYKCKHILTIINITSRYQGVQLGAVDVGGHWTLRLRPAGRITPSTSRKITVVRSDATRCDAKRCDAKRCEAMRSAGLEDSLKGQDWRPSSYKVLHVVLCLKGLRYPVVSQGIRSQQPVAKNEICHHKPPPSVHFPKVPSERSANPCKSCLPCLLLSSGGKAGLDRWFFT